MKAGRGNAVIIGNKYDRFLFFIHASEGKKGSLKLTENVFASLKYHCLKLNFLRVKTKIYLLVLIASSHFAAAQTSQTVNKPAAVKFDGIYECKEWEFKDGSIDNPAPAYYRFFADGTLLFCHYKDLKDKDSILNMQDIFHSVLSEENLNKIKENMADDPANVYKVYNKFKLTAYKYQKITGGLCFDILSEKPNCLGKPNMKIVDSKTIKTDNGNSADDRYFKFIQGN